jgi:hypothetical protein
MGSRGCNLVLCTGKVTIERETGDADSDQSNKASAVYATSHDL